MIVMPSVVLLIRHAEKPHQERRRVYSNYDANLSVRGHSRAEALAGHVPATFPKPDFLFAAKGSPKSNRPAETIAPLAKRLSLGINTDYADEDYQRLAMALLNDDRYDSRVVLICWHHGTLPSLAFALGAAEPPTWPAPVFDRIWRIDYTDGGAVLQDQPQRLLPGDSFF